MVARYGGYGRRGAPDLGWQAALLAGAALIGVLAGVEPLLAIGAAIAIGFVALVAADLMAGLCVFTFIAFVDILPGGPAFSFTKVIGLLLALSWLATIATRPRDEPDFFSAHPGAVWLLGLFLAWCSLSAVWAESSNEAITAASRYGLNFLLFPIAYTAIRERRHLAWLGWTFIAGAIFSAAFGLAVPQPTEEGRLAGAIGEANELASVLLAAGVLATGFAIVARKASPERLLAGAAAAICFAGVVFSLSRAALLALLLVALVSIFLAGGWRGRAAMAALVLGAVAVTWFGAFATPQARDRLTRFQGGTGRVDLWTLAGRMVEDRPLTGVGAGNYQLSTPRYLLQPGTIARDDFVLTRPKQTHNIYLQVLSELGVPGFVLFMAIIAFCLGCAAKAARIFDARGDPAMAMLAWTFAVAAVGVLATDFFQSEQYSKQLWLLLAVGPALLALAHRGGRRGDDGPKRVQVDPPAPAPFPAPAPAR